MAKGHEKDAYGNKNYGDKCTKFEFMNNGWPYNIIAEALAFGKKNALRTKKALKFVTHKIYDHAQQAHGAYRKLGEKRFWRAAIRTCSQT